MKLFHATWVLLLLSIVVTTPVPAAPLNLRTTTDSVASAASVFLPIVGHDFRRRPACSLQSPFSVQIAALHQVVSGEGGTSTTRDLTEAEWLELYGESFPTLVHALRASGACWARVRVDWAWIQPDPPPAPYGWGPYHDDKLRLVADTGVQLIAHVDGIPDWASDLPCGPIDTGRLDEFAQFLTELVRHYKEPPWNIHHWELFNEPDGTWPQKAGGGIGCWGFLGDRYAQMLAVAYPAIKAADPEAMVLMGGVAHEWFTEDGGPFNRYFPDDVMANGGAQHLDATNFHYFTDFRREWERWDANSEERRTGRLPGPTCGDLFDGQGMAYEAGGLDLIAKASHFRNRLRTCFGVDRPLWITELAEHGRAGDPDSLTQQARYVIQGYARGLAAGVQNITWFALVTPPYDSAQQGLLYDDFAPKPAFYAYQTLTWELADHTYARSLEVAGVEGYVFAGTQGTEKTVAWGNGPLLFNSASRLRIVDREGNVTFVDDGGAGDTDGRQDGTVVLQMTADPVFVSR